MIFLVYFLLSVEPLWEPTDVLIGNSLGAYVDFAVDYNYSTGDIYVAAIPDSGTCFGPYHWGLILFRSTNHGETWESLLSQQYDIIITQGEEVDIVVTRDDTVYVALSRHEDFFTHTDSLYLLKIYDATGSGWTSEIITKMPIPPALSDIHSIKLERNDFDDFNLFLSYIVTTTVDDDTLFLRYSSDRGYNWASRAFYAEEYKDIDLTIADSTLYLLSAYQDTGYYGLELHRLNTKTGASGGHAFMCQQDTLSHFEISAPSIGATTSRPDNGQLVYAVYSQKNLISQHYDLLYIYSQNGGVDWTSVPDTLALGSFSVGRSDVRGYQASPSDYVDITYCITSSVSLPDIFYDNYFRWASESSPEDWHDLFSVSSGDELSIPKLTYSPPLGVEAAVVYNDNLGNLWFDAPWRSGISEDTDEAKESKIRSQIVSYASSVEVNSLNAVVYDVTGREIKKLNDNVWDLTDEIGEKVDSGIYFILDVETGEKVKLSVVN